VHRVVLCNVQRVGLPTLVHIGAERYVSSRLDLNVLCDGTHGFTHGFCDNTVTGDKRRGVLEAAAAAELAGRPNTRASDILHKQPILRQHNSETDTLLGMSDTEN